jgi:hypothetical protein
MSEQTAARLARVKREHAMWSIRAVESGAGYTAHRGDSRLYAVSLTDLESQLRAADHAYARKAR